MQRRLFPSQEFVLVTWRKIFTAHRSKCWSDVQFTVPVSNAKLERMFSELKRFKMNFRCYFGVKLLKNILEIMEERSRWETFVPMNSNKELEQ